METDPFLACQIHQSPSASSLLPANLPHYSRRRFYHHHHHHHNVRRQPNVAMPLRGLNLRRITTARYHFRFNHPTEAFCITKQFASINHNKMAEESKNKDVVQEKVDPTSLIVTKGEQEKDKTSEKSTPPAIPPPPEKPLPGDCCGSGCVRCVWDVYYEELEEYNRVYKADSKISRNLAETEIFSEQV